MFAKTLIMKLMFRMMGLPTCEEVDQFAYDFLAGRLDAKIIHQVERHLKTCKNCQKFMVSYRKTYALAQNLPPPTLDSEFKEKMFKFLSKKGDA